MKRMIMVGLGTLLVTQIAVGQMMGGGGGHHGSAPGNGATCIGSGSNGAMGGMSGGMHGSVAAGAEGVLYALRTTASASKSEVVALGPNGSIAWTSKVTSGMTRLDVVGKLILVTSGSCDMDMDRNAATSVLSTEVIALSASDGTQQWRVKLDGMIETIEAFSGGFYVLVTDHDTTNDGGMHGGSTTTMTRSVFAIGDDGKTRWRLDLN